MSQGDAPYLISPYGVLVKEVSPAATSVIVQARPGSADDVVVAFCAPVRARRE
jgi:hypothetical protein